MIKKIYILAVFFFTITNLYGQISHGGLPKSFSFSNSSFLSKNVIDIKINVDELDNSREEDCVGCAKHVGFFIEKTIAIKDYDNWSELPDGSFVYSISFRLNEAKAVGVSFSEIFLPEGCSLFVYNNSLSEVYGSFIDSNVLKDGSFSTQPVSGNTICLEFNCNKDNFKELQFVIDGFSYFFETNFFNNNHNAQYKDSGDCQVNINCPEGTSIRTSANAVVKMVMYRDGGYYLCTGSLVNNTKQDRTPYILSAHHCAGSLNPASSSFQKWQFYFSYEVPLCSGTHDAPQNKSLIGCSYISGAGYSYPGGSDFLLLKLIDSVIPPDYYPYFAGWDISGNDINSAKSVHHPNGDVKKVSSSDKVEISTFPNSGGSRLTHLKVYWHETESGFGTTEGGSSGSPLFDPYGKIVGTLTGGNSSCSNLYMSDYYGRMSYSWNSNDTYDNNTSLRLDHWLDPINSGVLSLEGFNDEINITSILFSLNNSENFTSDKPTIMLGSTITFKAGLFGNPDSCYWEFEGAEPAFSKNFNPEPIRYNSYGSFSVKLTLYKEELSPKVFEYPDYVKVTPDYFPNPFENKITIVFNKDSQSANDQLNFKEIRLINLNGKTSYIPNKIEQKYNNLNLYFDNVIDGIYILQLVSEEDVINIKILKTKNGL
ncbi:T9SS type A sorting domain-containing protein [Bacteroidales bacterium OttesenSCG-928-K22]|nr:T9SS type A sorting domain-containing protein [Bacteroidales bacterium OttesenSCG-928-L14]MDL2240610.1 T9SS type A sorting domain-containing protein [Bacteroidales bacterium OttesenSCG-928-K22]